MNIEQALKLFNRESIPCDIPVTGISPFCTEEENITSWKRSSAFACGDCAACGACACGDCRAVSHDNNIATWQRTETFNIGYMPNESH